MAIKTTLLLFEADEDLIEKMGTHIVWHNDHYDTNWKIIRLPDGLSVHGEVLSDDFRKGWNYYRKTILTGINQFESELADKKNDDISANGLSTDEGWWKDYELYEMQTD